MTCASVQVYPSCRLWVLGKLGLFKYVWTLVPHSKRTTRAALLRLKECLALGSQTRDLTYECYICFGTARVVQYNGPVLSGATLRARSWGPSWAKAPAVFHPACRWRHPCSCKSPGRCICRTILSSRRGAIVRAKINERPTTKE